MKKRKQLVVWYMILALAFALFASVLLPTANATVISSSSDVLFTVSHNNSFDFVVIGSGRNTYTVQIPEYTSLLISDNSEPVFRYKNGITYKAEGWDASYSDMNLTLTANLRSDVYNYIVIDYAPSDISIDSGVYGNVGDNSTWTDMFLNTGFKWYWYQSSHDVLANSSLLNRIKNGNRAILFRTYFWAAPSLVGKNWTSLYENNTLLELAINNTISQISLAGRNNISLVVISEEEPGAGYGWENINEFHYVYGHNKIYDAVKRQYPDLPVVPGVHVMQISAENLSLLSRDGLVDDWYAPLYGDGGMSQWYDIMKAEQNANPNTYALIYAGSNWRYLETLTPDYTIDAFNLGVSKGIKNIGFFEFDGATEKQTIYFDSYNPSQPDYNRSELYKDVMYYLISNHNTYSQQNSNPIISSRENNKIISFQDLYQDYLGNWHVYNSENVKTHPLYSVIEIDDSYLVTRIDDCIILPKANTEYNFNTDRISFVLNLTPVQLNSRSMQDGTNWYFDTPKSLTSNQFIWDYKKPIVTNNTGYVIPDSNFWFINANGQPRLYYNQTARNVVAVSTYIKFEFNSFIVSNVTTIGWTDANITLNGSRFTDDGKLAINLRNDSALNMTNLTAYYSLDEGTGIIARNVNNESGLPNSTYEGTWEGFASINSTYGQIGNATIFDGIDDIIQTGIIPVVDGFALNFWVNPPNNPPAISGYVGKRNSVDDDFYVLQLAGLNTLEMRYRNSAGVFADIAPALTVTPNTWQMITFVKDGGQTSGYLNGKLIGTAVVAGTPANIRDFHIGNDGQVGSNFLSGSIDEVQMWNRSLSVSEIEVLYNTSLRTRGNVTIWKQNATFGYIIDRARLIINNSQVHNNTVDLYTKPNSSAVWNLTAINISNNTWYNIDAGNQSTSQDFLVAMSGNGSDTPFFTSLEWDETLIPVATPSISCANAYRDINSAFQLIGILLILFAAMMIIIGIQNYNNPSYLIMGATSGVIGAVMLAVGVFVVITVGTGAGCV